MSWNSIMGFISSVALFLPILFIIIFGLGSYKSFPALLSYSIIFFAFNILTEGYIKTSTDTVNYFNIGKNLLDGPLMMMFLIYFSASAEFTRKMKMGIVLMVVFEVIVVVFKGFTTDAITIILGPCLLAIFSFCIYFFARQTKITIMHHKASGKAIIAASLLFAYGCYTIIYLVYYVFKTPHVADTFLVYFLATTFSSLLMTAGIIVERRRVQKLNELKTTRKELSDIYNDTNTKKAAHVRAAMLDFDREQWN